MKHKAGAIPNHSLRRERELRGWSQQELAERIDAPSSYYISRWERGVISPSPLYREKLCTLFGKNAQELELLLEPQKAPDLILSETSTSSAEHEVTLWSVPYRRNPFFTGRDDVLEKLHASLCAAQQVALTGSLALYGLGGIGKTQTAVEYAYHYARAYSAIFWIRAETSESMHASLLQIADLLGLPERELAEQRRIVAAVQRWLATHQGWLLIWDNMEDLALFARYLPPLQQGAHLITTRCRTLSNLALGLELSPLPAEEGMLFLLRRASVLDAQAGCEQLQQLAQQAPDEYTRARELVEIMGGLPLALDQVGAYLEETPCSLADYLHLYRTRSTELLKRRGSDILDHPEPVTTTWALAFERVEQVNGAAADLLRLCAFLYPDAIPEEIFTLGATYLGERFALVAADPLRLHEAISTLYAYSLVSRNIKDHTLTFHRLVQAVLRECLDATTAWQWKERAVLALNATFPEPDIDDWPQRWPQCERCLPHVQWLSEQNIGSKPDAAHLFYKAGFYLERRARYSESEHLLTLALRMGEQQFGQHHLEVACMLNHLALVRWQQGKYQLAEPLFQRAVAIREAQLGETNPLVAIALDDLAGCYIRQGKYSQAESLLQRVISIWQQQPTSAEYSPRVRYACYHNLAVIYRELGHYERAESLFLRILPCCEKILPQEIDHGVAYPLCGLGKLYHVWGKHEQAESLFQRALLMREQQFGLEHPEVARNLQELGLLYVDQGKYQQAESLLQRALSIYELHLGADHPQAAACLYRLGYLFSRLKKYEQAISFYQRALDILKPSLGEMHPQTKQAVREYNAALEAIRSLTLGLSAGSYDP